MHYQWTHTHKIPGFTTNAHLLTRQFSTRWHAILTWRQHEWPHPASLSCCGAWRPLEVNIYTCMYIRINTAKYCPHTAWAFQLFPLSAFPCFFLYRQCRNLSVPCFGSSQNCLIMILVQFWNGLPLYLTTWSWPWPWRWHSGCPLKTLPLVVGLELLTPCRGSGAILEKPRETETEVHSLLWVIGVPSSVALPVGSLPLVERPLLGWQLLWCLTAAGNSTLWAPPPAPP